jgi:carbamoyltransferase
MITWGMSKNGHDYAIAVFIDSKCVATISDRGREHSIDCVRKAIQYGKPDLVVWYENPYLKAIRQLIAGQPKPFKRNNITKYLYELGITCRWTYVGHHESHAAAYYNSSFNDATIVVIDSVGEFDCTTVWSASGDRMKKIYSTRYPHSIGLFYSAMTDRVGLTPQQDESVFEKLSKDYDKYDWACVDSIVKDFVKCWTPMPKFRVNFHRGIRSWGKQFTNERIAQAAGHVFRRLLACVLWKARSLDSSDNIVISGGVAYNKSIRGLIGEDWNNIYIPPNPSDSGSAEGAVLAYMRNRDGK